MTIAHGFWKLTWMVSFDYLSTILKSGWRVMTAVRPFGQSSIYWKHFKKYMFGLNITLDLNFLVTSEHCIKELKQKSSPATICCTVEFVFLHIKLKVTKLEHPEKKFVIAY